MANVTAYSKTTGEKQIIPEEWLTSKNPALNRFTTDPTQPSSELEGLPSDSWKVADLKAYAEDHSIDLGDATKKDDIVAAIAAAPYETKES